MTGRDQQQVRLLRATARAEHYGQHQMVHAYEAGLRALDAPEGPA